ncbi:5'/3'-nucleotidase SurE [Alienimonas chondri]|uniref:5'-nucleotidase SurE n=1 Tax=Alienimonas chondri TaxID=2681879 RepID=A0ABX1VAI1_9PLAN|nr:5'/3'-nucleotidase SurE [Alienimonas chondri]NNJ24739.1 5'-nucleotidase SurE [Alienimonas chondri]
MHVLVVNDDGIHSPGLAALASAAAALGDVTVVAPAIEQSGVGLTITYRHPLMYEEVHRRRPARNGEPGERYHYGYAVHGSPADCAKLGVLELGPLLRGSRPDLVLSGINLGANVGHGVLYSGTVAGAIEAAFHGVTSVAVSCVSRDPDDWTPLAEYAVSVAGQLAERHGDTAALWNLNLPAAAPKGLKAVRCSPDRRGDLLERRDSPEGRPYYWTGMDPATAGDPAPDTDAGAVAAGYAALTPLRYDLTDPAGFAALRDLDLPTD